MPRDKDFKRRVRSRMQKTGESYTTARAQLLAKPPAETATPAPSGAPAAAPGALSPTTYADLAGMSDDAVEAKTGRTWPGWVELLDADGWAERPHREIAAHLKDDLGLPAWWSQTVTVGYERIKGLRDVGQRRTDGTYEANKSKTFHVPVATLYAAFDDPARRRRWLPGIDLTVRTASAEKSARLTWPDGTHVDLAFAAKGDAKSQLAVQHRKLADPAEIESRKAYWAERLKVLGEVLAETAGG
jgi:hypothetical protein